MNCNLCPRNCNIDREKKTGYCGMGNLPKVAKAFLHMWEEPCISGVNGSGTVFFSGCNLKCVYCQNYKISQEDIGVEISIERLREIFTNLKNIGAHNINLVNPTHYTVQISKALRGVTLDIPIVYNSNAYEKYDGLKLMNGIVDVYMPDLKYLAAEVSMKYSRAEDYFKVAVDSIKEMYYQVGGIVFNSDGMLVKGLIIRHLILPGQTAESIKILDFIKSEFPDNIIVSLMSQYTPYYKAECYPEIGRRITRREYDKVVNHFYKLGIKNGYIQERDSANEDYIPNFDLEGI